MNTRALLQIPGPTNLPERVRLAMGAHMVNHRGAYFTQLLEETSQSLKRIFQTKGDILFFPSSGSGIIESVIVNLFSKGDKILVASNGLFGERAGIIAKEHGLELVEAKLPWGKQVNFEQIKEILLSDKDIKAVYLPQNETSTGVENNVESIGKGLKEINHKALLIVDVVSSLAILPFHMDKWGVDVAIGASQKGLMLPPGLGIVALNQKAWDYVDASNVPKWYWNYRHILPKEGEYQLPYTPPTAHFFGLREATQMIEEEGLEELWKRHSEIATMTRKVVTSLGLKLVADEGTDSDAVTAIYLPESITWPKLNALMQEKYNITLGGGLQRLSGKVFRIGHMGYISKLDMASILLALAKCLHDLGYDVPQSTLEVIFREL